MHLTFNKQNKSRENEKILRKMHLCDSSFSGELNLVFISDFFKCLYGRPRRILNQIVVT